MFKYFLYEIVNVYILQKQINIFILKIEIF